MIKKRIIKDDGRYLIFYSFPDELGERDADVGTEVSCDVGAEMESDCRGMGGNGDTQAR